MCKGGGVSNHSTAPNRQSTSGAIEKLESLKVTGLYFPGKINSLRHVKPTDEFGYKQNKKTKGHGKGQVTLVLRETLH